ncbi:hypothetical protein F2Q68_00013517 [Brassica cretica]|uniref:Uncharacterized protein n=1 Tax=Brassica cretica TaxID=69181 RepID=A0A8S9H6M1_BRACR|nr:hypothetical protein F2Q68_00013517 [Brassica cretica]
MLMHTAGLMRDHETCLTACGVRRDWYQQYDRGTMMECNWNCTSVPSVRSGGRIGQIYGGPERWRELSERSRGIDGYVDCRTLQRGDKEGMRLVQSTKNVRSNSRHGLMVIDWACSIPIPQSELDQSKAECIAVELVGLSWSDSDKAVRLVFRENYLMVTEWLLSSYRTVPGGY